MVIIPTEKRFDWRHTPVVLFCLVLLNILIFLLYQSGDGPKLERALTTYQQYNLLDLEWPVYERYLAAEEQNELLELYRDMHSNGNQVQLSVSLLMDLGFKDYLQREGRQSISNLRLDDWLFGRDLVNEEIRSLSYLQGGLIPSQLNPLSLLSYQFLHSDVMHLLGNLFFLLVCGFAVEAAIGHLRFLIFYLLTGLAGGLAHAAMDWGSNTPLIGASGAVSGVMAMYLGVFRFKRIEFFYWFFVFVGYFRAPALLILPVYVGKEVVDHLNNPDAGVAFMAHAGGFVAGGLLIAAALLINPHTVDSDYVEEDQGRDPYQEGLAKVLGYIENFQFQPALKAVDGMLAEFGRRPELVLMRCQLLKIHAGEDYRQALHEALRLKDPAPRLLVQQASLWRDNEERCESLDDDSTIDLAFRLATPAHFDTAERVLAVLMQRQRKHLQLPLLARKLAQVAGTLKQDAKRDHYQQLAEGT